MKISIQFFAFALVFGAFLVPIDTAWSAEDPELSAKHVAAAQAAAGEEFAPALGHCENIGKPFEIDKSKVSSRLQETIRKGEPRPYAVFDNLYFLGTGAVGAWAIRTSGGVILVDTLNNSDEAKEYIEAGLQRLGIDPSEIKKVIISHAHGDHYGGAVYLKEKYGSEIIMSDTDWKELEKPTLQFDSPLWGRPPVRDVTVRDGDLVTLGDTSVKILVTPGHTPGTIATIIPLKKGDTQHKAVIWGGNGLNFGKVSERFVAMMDSATRIGDMAEQENIDVFLSNHPRLDATFSHIDALEAGAPNSFVIGTSGVRRVMTTLRHCVAAQLASFDAAAVPED
jgi:metallo-beta-lactamase class B